MGSDFASMRKLDLILNYENIMVVLQKYLNKLIDFYSENINSSNLYFEDTKKILNNDSYIYSFVVKDMVILRQFIKTKTNIYSNATNLSLIPLKKSIF